MSVTMRCLPVSAIYFTESTSLIIRLVILFSNALNRHKFSVNALEESPWNFYTGLCYSNLDVELEIKDPDLLVVPSFCLGQPLEETPEGTVNSFLNEFM